MSFSHYKERVEDGDTVIFYLGFDNMLCYVVGKEKTFQTKYGAVKCKDLIGSKYGCKFHCPRGFLYILHPTPELWTVNVPHRTQILYTTDISMIALQLDLRPGTVVVESGTGSASLSHAIIRSIMPTGHLHTFEFHEQRVEKAKEEFKCHGLSEFVTVTHRDVVEHGFQLDHIADAVFLDLPSPWSVIKSAKKALKIGGGRICSFSPCIEQVQRTTQTLQDEHFTEITTLECLVRNFDVRTVNVPLPDLGDPVSEDISQPSCKKLAPNDDVTSKEGSVEEISVDGSEDKHVKHTEEPPSEATAKVSQAGDSEKTETLKTIIGNVVDNSVCIKTAANIYQMPGHTGYLTFATLYSV